jgi:hypothetical protein
MGPQVHNGIRRVVAAIESHCEMGNGRTFEQHGHWQLLSELDRHTSEQASRAKAVTGGFEKVVVDAGSI